MVGEHAGKLARAVRCSVASGTDDCARRSGIVTEYDGGILLIVTEYDGGILHARDILPAA